ncbi:MAG: hypothetical protein IKQ70_10035 [Bacteroidales bacterium]|nr:hypothetical protein [Bacteroidales bacterium]
MAFAVCLIIIHGVRVRCSFNCSGSEDLCEWNGQIWIPRLFLCLVRSRNITVP